VSYPRISIVTPSYNQGHFIEETILSIVTQDYPDIELIIIDGGSTDNSVEVIKKYADRIKYWVSEKDSGQADALNKGFLHATGEICCYLNSDDCFYPGAFREIARVFSETNAKWVASSTIVSESPELHSRIWPPDVANFPFFVNMQTFAQQGVFWKRDVSPLPFFNADFFYAMDHDFFCKLYNLYGPPATTNVITSFFRVQANSKTNLFEQRLVSDMQKTRAKYIASSDKATAQRIDKEFRRLESVKLLQSKLRHKEPVSFAEAVRIFVTTPYRFRNRQLIGLLISACFRSRTSSIQ
jgi:glycosyltransferase involved in cell wall biosynthesis